MGLFEGLLRGGPESRCGPARAVRGNELMRHLAGFALGCRQRGVIPKPFQGSGYPADRAVSVQYGAQVFSFVASLFGLVGGDALRILISR